MEYVNFPKELGEKIIDAIKSETNSFLFDSENLYFDGTEQPSHYNYKYLFLIDGCQICIEKIVKIQK